MKKEGSTASMLRLDIRRGFCSKRFWGIGVVTIVFVVFLTLLDTISTAKILAVWERLLKLTQFRWSAAFHVHFSQILSRSVCHFFHY